MTYYDIYDVLGCGGARPRQVSQDNIKTNAHKTENNTKCKEAFRDTVVVRYFRAETRKIKLLENQTRHKMK